MTPVERHCLPSGLGQECGERAFVYVRACMCKSGEKVMSVKNEGEIFTLTSESKDKKSQGTEKRDTHRLKAINRQ